jgi:hypothetical protein
MTTKIREYAIKIPFTLQDYRRGQRYVLAKYTTDEVIILENKQRKEDKKVISECKKILNLKKRLPSILTSVLNEKSLLLDEYSINIDEYSSKNELISSSCVTSYVNQYYDTDTFTLTVKTMTSSGKKENIFKEKNAKLEDIDLSDSKDGIFIYKFISITINSMLVGWMADHIKNAMKNMLLKFQKKVIETENEWKNISEEELVVLEKAMCEKFKK